MLQLYMYEFSGTQLLPEATDVPRYDGIGNKMDQRDIGWIPR